MGPEPILERAFWPGRAIRGREGREFEKGGGIFGIDTAMITN
jgi:hypothetical protein